MRLSKEDAREGLEISKEYLEDIQQQIENDPRGQRNAPLVHSLGSEHERLGKFRAVLDEQQVSREHFHNAATRYLDHVKAVWEQEDSESLRAVRRQITGGIECALVAGDDDLALQLARQARTLSEYDMSTFAIGSQPRAKEVFQVRNAQLWATTLLNDLHGYEFLEEYRDAGSAANEEFLGPMADLFEGFVTFDDEQVRSALARRLRLHEQRFEDGYDTLLDAVNLTDAAFAHLADRRGIDVSVESEFVPEALLPPEGGSEDVRQPAPRPIGATQMGWEDDSEDLLVQHVLRFDEDRKLNTTDIPDDEFGPVLSDAWFDAVRAHLATTSAPVDEAVRDALDAGDVYRNLVVMTPRSDPFLMDESFEDHPVDGVDFWRR